MKRFIFGFIIGFLIAVLIGAIFVFAALRFGGERRVSVSNDSTLVLHLEGDLPEQPPVEISLPFFSEQPPLTMLDVWQTLRKAAADSRIRAIVLEPRDLSVDWGKLQELHDDVAEFKKSGKPVYAYLRGATSREYYVATAADRIYMSPEDELDVKGLAAQLFFVKGTLDKLGVEMEFEHIGKYKDAPDMFTRTTPTPETLEVTNEILDQFYSNLTGVIANGRKKQPAAIQALINRGPFVGNEAMAGGLIDGLLYEDQVFDQVKNRLNMPIKTINEQDYARAQVSGMEGPSHIAYVVAEGDITRGGTYAGITDTGITATGMVSLLKQVENDSSIKGVIFRINSPGGDGIASDDILHAAKELSAKKPMVISMSDLAASGGYFIAMTGDPIVAYPNTETGSIGVFYGKANLQDLLKKVGVTDTTLKRGQFSDIESMTRPLTDDERTKLRDEIQVFYRQFVERVAAGRKRPYDQIEPLAQGRVWTGAQAKQNGLVDDLGGLDRAVEMIKAKAGIPASQKVTLVTFPPRRTLMDLILNRLDSSANAEAAIQKKLEALVGPLPLTSLIHGGILGLMPYRVQVR